MGLRTARALGKRDKRVVKEAARHGGPSSRRSGRGAPALEAVAGLFGRQGPRPARAAWPSGFLAGAFFLSGASALIYELLWFRLLGHIFGSTATAASTLLAAYLFGLGLGAWIFGKLSDRLGRLALVYVAIEVVIGSYGLISQTLLERGAALYAIGYEWAAGSAAALLLTRFLISFVLVAIPTTLMGGTFPLMVHLLKARRVDVGRATGRAYAINTAGAAFGTIGLPSLLLPSFGVGTSLMVAAAANFAAALLTLLYAWRSAPAAAESAAATGEISGLAPSSAVAVLETSPAPPAPRSEESSRRHGGTAVRGEADAGRVEDLEPETRLSPTTSLMLGFFLSSFASLALETVWVRHLGLFFGAQTYTFAFVLCAYLLGLFLGGALYARLRALGFNPAFLFRGGLLLSAFTVALPLPLLEWIAIPQIKLMLMSGVSNGSFLMTSGLVTMGLILPPALGFGLVFPAVVDLLSRRGRPTGASVGFAYAVNTLGTTLGALAAGFLLVPLLGSQRTIELCVLLVAGAYLLSWRIGDVAPGRVSKALRYGIPAAFLILLVGPRWDWKFAHAQYVKDPLSFLEKYKSGSLWPAIRQYKIPYLREGTEATVSVCILDDGSQVLYVNGKPDASDVPADMVAQRLLACVPGLFHPDPKTALVIGVGSGTTVGTLKRFPLEAIDAAEISPEVGEAAVKYFWRINDRFNDDPRVRIRLDDGRNFLHFRPSQSYDIIISEPSNPWMAGVSGLFTREFFAEVKDKLRPGGVFCQWFHYYNMSVDHIRLLARTFRTQFPEAAMFVIRGQRPTGDIILIGSKGPLRMARLPEDPSLPEAVRAALVEVHNGGTQQLLSGLVAAPQDFASFARTGPLNTDDLPILEFEAPADRFNEEFFRTLAALLTSTERTFLPAGPLPEHSPAAAEIARDGFTLLRGLPAGGEVRRGVAVLARQRTDADALSRWALVGREFEEGGITIGLHRLARALARPDELVDISAALAGEVITSRSEFTVNGHLGIRTLAETGSKRVMVLGWNCTSQDRAFLISRTAPAGPAADPDETASDLASRYVCTHFPPARPPDAM